MPISARVQEEPRIAASHERERRSEAVCRRRRWGSAFALTVIAFAAACRPPIPPEAPWLLEQRVGEGAAPGGDAATGDAITLQVVTDPGVIARGLGITRGQLQRAQARGDATLVLAARVAYVRASAEEPPVEKPSVLTAELLVDGGRSRRLQDAVLVDGIRSGVAFAVPWPPARPCPTPTKCVPAVALQVSTWWHFRAAPGFVRIEWFVLADVRVGRRELRRTFGREDVVVRGGPG